MRLGSLKGLRPGRFNSSRRQDSAKLIALHILALEESRKQTKCQMLYFEQLKKTSEDVEEIKADLKEGLKRTEDLVRSVDHQQAWILNYFLDENERFGTLKAVIANPRLLKDSDSSWYEDLFSFTRHLDACAELLKNRAIEEVGNDQDSEEGDEDGDVKPGQVKVLTCLIKSIDPPVK
ncbi:hypothetical protein B0T20DRAFT_391173 [Sordaria brevicollis]|uniref:Uncharacterized protein n=1 Tax=Sordaria brevicollis TaxID=83679 RepID=A0AAE0PGL8_SORBR|nr:hypothetical protein B0T20DRAFT_391173 [Sordaria brevicollis]